MPPARVPASGATTVDAGDDEPGGLIVEHYRLDASALLRRTLGLASLIVTVGALLMAAAIALPRLDPDRRLHAVALRTSALDAAFRSEVSADGAPIVRDTRPSEVTLGLFGLACIVLGGLTAIVGLRRVLSEESYLVLRTDGAYFRRGAERSLVRWDDVEEVRWDASLGALRFERHDGTSWVRSERFAGIEGPPLAARASEIRRKALFGLLRAP